MASIRHTGIVDVDEIFAVLEAEGYFNLFVWQDAAGTAYPEHIHPHDEVRWMVSGRLRIVENGAAIELGPGDRMQSDARVPHSAFVPETARYVCGSRLPKNRNKGSA